MGDGLKVAGVADAIEFSRNLSEKDNQDDTGYIEPFLADLLSATGNENGGDLLTLAASLGALGNEAVPPRPARSNTIGTLAE